MSTMEKGQIVGHHQVAPDIYSLEFVAPAAASLAQPGQFLQVMTGSTQDPLLRRPISLFDVDQGEGLITLLYRVVGKGTRLLTVKQAGDRLDIMGPLGRGFTLPGRPENIILVGGGMGLAPLLFLGRVLHEYGHQVRALGGAADSRGLWAGHRFERLGIPFFSATMDGSAGIQGLVTQLLEELPDLDSIDRIYCCGPEAMMAACARIAAIHSIWGEVSLEEHMACGVGACLGCCRQLKMEDPGYVKVCKDGPVFGMREVQLYKLD